MRKLLIPKRYSLTDQIMASSIHSFSDKEYLHHFLWIYQAIQNIESKGLTPEYWCPLLYAMSMIDALVLNKIYKDDDKLVNKSLEILYKAADAEAFVAEADFNFIKSMVWFYSEAYKALPERVIIAAHRRASKKILKAK
jgi:hypothetical protein